MPTAVLQFIIQPIIAKQLGSELNGQYLTLMSLNYFMIGITASVLNTVRLLQQKQYDENNLRGDFNIFFCIYAVFIVIVMPLGYRYYTGSSNPVDLFLFVVISLLYLYHDYIFVQYRLKLQYNKILINNIILVAGYFLGLLAFREIRKWQIVIICAYALGAIYDFFNTDLIREPVRKTPLFQSTLKKTAMLTVSTALSSAITYCDKLLLYPVLGGTSVSVYNTASIVGKMLILVSAPLNSVLLSYIVRVDQLHLKFKKKQIVLFSLGLIAAYCLCVGIGFPLTDFLYPDWASTSQKYIPITVAASLFVFLGNLLNTVVIRFYKASFQVMIQAVNLVIYLLASLLCLHFWSLWGFCIGVAAAGLIKMVMLIVILFTKKPDESPDASNAEETA